MTRATTKEMESPRRKSFDRKHENIFAAAGWQRAAPGARPAQGDGHVQPVQKHFHTFDFDQ
jgi:hypothetical protein